MLNKIKYTSLVLTIAVITIIIINVSKVYLGEGFSLKDKFLKHLLTEHTDPNTFSLDFLIKQNIKPNKIKLQKENNDPAFSQNEFHVQFVIASNSYPVSHSGSFLFKEYSGKLPAGFFNSQIKPPSHLS